MTLATFDQDDILSNPNYKWAFQYGDEIENQLQLLTYALISTQEPTSRARELLKMLESQSMLEHLEFINKKIL